MKRARKVMSFTVASSTTKRGDELTHILIQRIHRLPKPLPGMWFQIEPCNGSKTTRDEADKFYQDPGRGGTLGDGSDQGNRKIVGSSRNARRIRP